MKTPIDFRVDPIPELEFFEEQHAYRYQGEWIPFSMTQVCKGNNTYFSDTQALPDDHPDKIRLNEALTRGSAVHDFMEAWAKGETLPEHPYIDWTNSCISDPFWDRWSPVSGGVELSLIDPRPQFRIAGRCDIILRNTETGELAMADYKTQSSRQSRPYNVKPQLGGYLNLCDQHANTRHLGINRCFAIWIRPGNTHFQPLDGEDCIQEYLAARKTFFDQQPSF